MKAKQNENFVSLGRVNETLLLEVMQLLFETFWLCNVYLNIIKFHYATLFSGLVPLLALGILVLCSIPQGFGVLFKIDYTLGL